MKIRLDSGDGSKMLTLLPNSGETLQPMKAYVSVYNANGTIKLVKVYEGVADNNGNSKITIEEPSVENGESYKIMLWDAKFAPVIKAIIK